MGLITETNEEYYAGEKVFLIAAATNPVPATSTVKLVITPEEFIVKVNFKPVPLPV